MSDDAVKKLHTITPERIGRRTYLRGLPHGFREQLKPAGGKWDKDEKAWWIANDEVANELAHHLETCVPDDGTTAKFAKYRAKILGVATCDGREYWLVEENPQGQHGPWVRLMVKDGSRFFSRSASDVTIVQRYIRTWSLKSLQEREARKNAEKTE